MMVHQTMSKVDFIKSRDFVQWCIAETIANSTERNSFYEMLKNKNYDPDNLDVRLIINGCEFDFIETIELMEQQLDNSVHERAKRLVQEKFNESIFYPLYEMQQKIERMEHEVHNNINDVFDNLKQTAL
jgi:hypothetical protein